MVRFIDALFKGSLKGFRGYIKQFSICVHLQDFSLLAGLKSNLSISRNSAITGMDKKIHSGGRPFLFNWEQHRGSVCVCLLVKSNYIML